MPGFVSQSLLGLRDSEAQASIAVLGIKVSQPATFTEEGVCNRMAAKQLSQISETMKNAWESFWQHFSSLFDQRGVSKY